MRRYIVPILLFVICSPAFGQASDWCQPESKFCFAPTLIMPGSHVFFDQGADLPGEFDLFKDGKITLDLQLVGVDLYRPIRQGQLKYGVNAGLGTSSATEGAPVVLITVSGFVQIREHMRVDFGWIEGFSAEESPGPKDDSAVFVGLSFPTNLGEALKTIF